MFPPGKRTESRTGPARKSWEQLLRPFERGSGVQSLSGSGLGLPLVAALVARWDARLEPVWDGYCFTVRVIWPDGSSDGSRDP